MKVDLTGKVAVVTGGGGILCSVMAEALAKSGAKVAILDLREENAKNVAAKINAAGGKAIGLSANVLELESLQKANEIIKAELGPCNILINGTGGNGTNIKGEFSLNGWDNPLSHTRGAISMARADDYDSASSQFFICQEDCSIDLDGKYACFGYVTEGMEIVDEICAGAQPIDENGSIIDSEQPVITSIVIRTA